MVVTSISRFAMTLTNKMSLRWYGTSVNINED